MSRRFVHLHVHTQYSMLDGAVRLDALVAAAESMGAVAMTDHGNLYGAVEFVHICAKKGKKVKPIIGMCMNIGAVSDDSKRATYHLTALCRTEEGYRNLVRMISLANLDHYDEKRGFATIPFELFRQYCAGLTILSGDLGSELASAILRGDENGAEKIIECYRSVADKGSYYLEIMANTLPEQSEVNEALKRLSVRTGVPLVATNDCHYLHSSEAVAHAMLIVMQLKQTVTFEALESTAVSDFYLKSAEEMYDFFSDVPEACENSAKIADEINFELPLGPVYLPQYKVPVEFLTERGIEDAKVGIHEYFRQVSRDGLEKRFSDFRRAGKSFDETIYKERLETEIDIICKMDFPGYFLIVWDFINWSKEQDIPVGPGRGSGAGSLVAYSMQITDIDPIPYALLFERFLNPERVSMPDFDIDFCMDRRKETIDYVTRKYGQHNVSQIAAFGGLKAKACLKGVGRCLNIDFATMNALAKLMPNDLNITLTSALAESKALKEAVDGNPLYKKMYDIALNLEGLYNSLGMHAAGIVISEKPLWEYVPVCRGANMEIVTQYPKGDVEDAGLVKFDFLGLKTLTVIKETLRIIGANRKADESALILGDIPMDDEAVFQLIQGGDTVGVFQLESDGFKKLLQKLKPDCFEDIIAAVALYRPGPLEAGMVDQFIDCKHGLKEVEYPHESLRGVLKETYGVFVYQEQVMQAAQILSGYSLGEADIMRRAMGKKKPEEMAKQRSKFVDGAHKKGVDPKQAGDIFDKIEKFAGYGFNKSHSAAYAMITYQTAYLKAHYPSEFSAALMSCDSDTTEKVVKTMIDARKHGLTVLPPDINFSDGKFSVNNGVIRFGLGAVKGLGSDPIENIVKERENKAFVDIFDFCERVDGKKNNRRVMESLIKCGAFDSLWPLPTNDLHALANARARMLATIDMALSRGAKVQKEKEIGQNSLFAAMPKNNAKRNNAVSEYLSCPATVNEKEMLEAERDVLGFFVSGHPLDSALAEIEQYTPHNTQNIKTLQDGQSVSIGALISSFTVKSVKNGNMGILKLEDPYGQIEGLCFNKTLDEYRSLFSEKIPLFINGKVSVRGDDPENPEYSLRIFSVKTLEQTRVDSVKFIHFILDAGKHDKNTVDLIFRCLNQNRGNCASYMTIRYPDSGCVKFALKNYPCRPNDRFLADIKSIVGTKAVELSV